MKAAVTVLTLLALASVPLNAAGPQTIQVDQLAADAPGDQSVANLITAKLISALTKRGLPVVEDEADAVLTGSYQIASASRNGYTRYRIQGAMRLSDKDGKVLWGDVVTSGAFARSASSSFADNVAEKVAAFWKHR